MVSAKVAVVSPFVPGFSNLLPVAAPYVEITDEITTTWTPVGPDPQRPIFTPPNLINIDRLTQRSKLKFLQVGNTTVGVKTSIPSDGITIETISLFCNTLTYHIQASQISAPGMAQASCSNFLGQYLGQYYLSIGSCFKDKITLADICYSMLQKFHYGSTWYIPLSILRKLQENKTEINGVPFIMDANQTNVPATSVNGDYSDVAEIIQA